MSIDRKIWLRRIDENFKASYPCPRCTQGRVRRGENPITLIEPHHSKREHALEEWDPSWIQMRFTTMLTCDNPTCGEVVAVSGYAGVDDYYDYDYDGNPNLSYATWLQPLSMVPAPPLFPITKNVPREVRKELQLAFQLFWTDLSASTSRLRTSLERVLDDKGIAKSELDKKGEMRRLQLVERIDRFKKASSDTDVVESMTAMRVVGNIGTHGDEVVEGDYFDLLEVYEDALAEIYEQKSAKLKAKKAALIDLKNK